MKKYIKFLLITALILGIACTVREHYLSDRTADNQHLPRELILINRNNSIPENFEVDLTEVQDGEQVDKRIYIYLEEMLADAVKAGYDPEITSGYRPEEYQKEIFNNKVAEYRDAGHSKREAEKQASLQIAKPGHSEHETGLAVDINSADGNSWELYGWLKENSFRYGFIIRYPYGKENITGISYEPWHLRFVGKESAEYIFRNNITLEEYLLLQ